MSEELRKASADAIRIMEQHQGTWRHTSFDFVIADLKAALAEPEQSEPVMWAYQYDDGTWHDASATEHSAGMKPLFAHPPRREPLPRDALTVNLMRIAGLDKHQARECADVVLLMLGAQE